MTRKPEFKYTNPVEDLVAGLHERVTGGGSPYEIAEYLHKIQFRSDHGRMGQFNFNGQIVMMLKKADLLGSVIEVLKEEIRMEITDLESVVPPGEAELILQALEEKEWR